MTDVEIDTLTSAYDNDATLKQMTEVMDAPRKALVDHLVQVGRLAPEVGQMWKETVGYVPFDRVKDDVRYFRVQRRVGRGLAQYGQLPELVGSEARPVDNVFTNYVNTLGWMVAAATTERSGRSAVPGFASEPVIATCKTCRSSSAEAGAAAETAADDMMAAAADVTAVSCLISRGMRQPVLA